MSTLDAATQRFLAQYSDAAEALDGGDLRGSWHGSSSRSVMLLTIGSLFSGYGGLDRAVEEVFSARTVWVSDIEARDKHGRKVGDAPRILAYRYPDAPNLGDITRVDWAAVPRVDIITGGSPCQDVSTAGRRAGMVDGTRSNLWIAMRDAIAALKPAFVIWENVHGALSARAASAMESDPGLLGDHQHSTVPALRALGRVLGDLADLGFDAEWHGLRASDIGACHGRARVFVLAAHPERVARLGWTGLRAGDSGRLGRGRPDDDARQAAPVDLLPTPSAGAFNDGEGPAQWEARRQRVKVSAGNGNGMGMPLGVAVQMLPTGHARNLSTVGQLLPTPSVADATGGHERRGGQRGGELLLNGLAKDAARWGDYAAAIARHERPAERPAPDPTEPGPTGRPRLSAAFAEWMMCQPAGWVTDVPGMRRNWQLHALGNGVVTPQAAHALRVMLARLDLTGWSAA